MDLYSGLPYWIAKNPLDGYYNPLKNNFETEVLIIGTGITGALVAHELATAGIQCAMIDKRNVSTGSSIASTALLQYEIDVPLCEMVKTMDVSLAVEAYRSCLASISDYEKVFDSINYDPDFVRVPTVFYASDRKGLKLIEQEYEIRRKYELPVKFLTKREVNKKYGIKVNGALTNNYSAQTDTYAAATHLIGHHLNAGNLDVFTHTLVKKWACNENGCEVIAENNHKIKCRYIIVAAGFEADYFLPRKVMNLTSTYAIISQPVDESQIWTDRALIWETKEPYLYVRTTKDNRIIVGGEDENFKNPELRDRLLRKKVQKLEKRIKKLFPDIPFVTDMAWCGTFSSTDDGLPYIGAWPGNERMLYALGYGGNGITFSMIAAQILKNKILGVKDEREKIFGFDRI